MRTALLILLLCLPAFAGRLPLGKEAESDHYTTPQVGMRMKRRFALGVSGGGPLALMGLEADLVLTDEISVSAGLGTGIDYTSAMVKGRFFLLDAGVAPYLGLGFARWWTQGTYEKNLAPSLLANRFLPAGADPRQGFDAFLFYPCLGVQFLHPMGIAVSIELEYLFKLITLANGAYAGMGIHWYF